MPTDGAVDGAYHRDRDVEDGVGHLPGVAESVPLPHPRVVADAALADRSAAGFARARAEELLARPGDDHDRVVAVQRDVAESLGQCPVGADAPVQRPAVFTMEVHLEDAVVTPRHREVLRVPLAVILEFTHLVSTPSVQQGRKDDRNVSGTERFIPAYWRRHVTHQQPWTTADISSTVTGRPTVPERLTCSCNAGTTSSR